MQAGPRLRPERLWLLLGVTWVIAFTLAPFDLSFAPNELPARISETLRIGDTFYSLKFAGHLVSFFALGLVAVANSSAQQKRRFSRLLVIGVLGWIVLETAQLFQPGRHARLTDFVLNITGFAAGLLFATRTAPGQQFIAQLRSENRRSLFGQIATAASALVAWWIICLQPAFGALRMNWDRTFPLTIGNEIGGARPWSGQIRFIGIYGVALSASAVRALYGSLDKPSFSEVRGHDALLAGYDFRRAAPPQLKAQGELVNDNLDLDLPPDLRWSPVDGVAPSAFGVLKTPGSAAQLINRIASSAAFSVEAWGQTANLRQAGPARLVSVSSGPAARNFTLGQAGPDLIFRVRNKVNSANGNVHELAAPNVIATRLQQFVATYDHGVSTIYTDGRCQSTVDLREPVFYSGLATGGLARAALLTLAVMTISLSASFIFQTVFRSSTAWIAAIVFTLIAGILPYLISCLMVGGPLRVNFLAWFFGALLLVYPPGLLFMSLSRNDSDQKFTNSAPKGAGPACTILP